MLNELFIFFDDGVFWIGVVIDARAVHQVAEVHILDVGSNLLSLSVVLH